MRCPDCRANSPSGAKFCPECGHSLAAIPATYTPRHISEQILAVPSAVKGERKHVTVLFCDIVRSGELAAELGPEEYHQVIDGFFSVAMAEVHRFGGTINQFLGDGFMALFGAPIAREDHARRAVLSALGVVDRAAVTVRVGINTGLVVVGAIGDDRRVDYTAFGDTTVLAARLQAAAEPGAVLVSQRTAAQVRRYFDLAEVTPVRVKERTVYPMRVIGMGTRTAPIASGDELSPFSGRDSELAELHRALEITLDGEGQLVGLTGDPGLGKSRLAWEFAQFAEQRATVLACRCLSYGADVAYLPLFELVRHACGIAADEPADVMAAKIDLNFKSLELDVSLAHYVNQAFAVAGSDAGLRRLDPQVVRRCTFDALRRMLVAQARRGPLVVLAEDLHWIDQTSEDFLAEFADEVPSAPIMFLATYRPGYSPPWIGKSLTSQLALRPLAAASTERIVASILEAQDQTAVAAIAARGEGNPFFLEELARAAREQLASAARGQVAEATEVTVPETVQQVLAARLDRLSADQKAAIQLAAVLGREFSLDLASEIWEGEVSLESQLDELKAQEFLRERHGAAERTFAFKHALTRDVAYDGMLRARRRELHGRVGAALAQSQSSERFEHSELLGYHYSRSGDPARAIPYLAAAGDRARNGYSNEEAVALYRHAIGLIEDLKADNQADVYAAACESLGIVLHRLSRFDAAIEAYGKGLAVAGDAFQLAHLHALCCDAEEGAYRYQEALAHCDLADQALGPAPEAPERAWISAWLAVQNARMSVLYWLNDTQEHAKLIELARPFVETHGSAEQRASFLISVLGLAMRQERYLVTDETLELARAADAAAQEAEPSPFWWAIFELGFALLWHEDLDEAAAVLRHTVTEAERRGDTTTRSRALTYLMVAGRKKGDVEGVRMAIGAVIQRAREASLPAYEAMAIANRAWVAWRRGEDEQAAADALTALEIWERHPARYPFYWMALWPLVAVALAAHQLEQAVGHARDMLPPPQQLLHEPARALLDGAVSAWDEGRPDEAEELLRRAVRTAADLGYL